MVNSAFSTSGQRRTGRIRVLAASLLAALLAFALAGCSLDGQPQAEDARPASSNPAAGGSLAASPSGTSGSAADALADVPAYAGEPYIELNGNEPGFTAEDATTDAFESYSPLDGLGRCGQAYACLGLETMPTEERQRISEVHPTGWHTDTYDFVDGGLLYNRSHLIAFQLSGENANERNLITGTRYFNSESMLPFEEMVGDYIRQTGNHVLDRVTPLFVGDELVARGVQMEALSMEDGGAGIRFNVFVYNVQPGVEIDYATGDNWLADENDDVATAEGDAGRDDAAEGAPASSSAPQDYVVNTNSMRFHDPSCPSVADIAPGNRMELHTTREGLLAQGFEPCGGCRP